MDPNQCNALIAQLVDHQTCNPSDNSLSPALNTGRNGPPMRAVVKWVPGIWTRLASWLFKIEYHAVGDTQLQPLLSYGK